MTLQDSIEQFCDGLTVKNTHKTYRTGVRNFAAFLEKRRNLDTPMLVSELGESDLKDFAVYLQKRKYSKFSIGTYVAGVVEYLKDAVFRKQMPDSFSIERAKIHAKSYRKLGSYPIHEPKPVEKIIAYYENAPVPDKNGKQKREYQRLEVLRGRALAWFLFATGCRIGEARSIDRKDVADGRATQLILHHAKGDKDRFLYLPETGQVDLYSRTRDAITAYVSARADAYEPLFISHARDKGKRLSEEAIARIVKSAAAEIGEDITPHDFRHARARQMINAGVPLEVIQEFLGHSGINTTRTVYAHYQQQTIKDAVVKYAPQIDLG